MSFRCWDGIEILPFQVGKEKNVKRIEFFWAPHHLWRKMFLGVQHQLNIRGKARISLAWLPSCTFCHILQRCRLLPNMLDKNRRYRECSNLTNDLAASIAITWGIMSNISSCDGVCPIFVHTQRGAPYRHNNPSNHNDNPRCVSKMQCGDPSTGTLRNASIPDEPLWPKQGELGWDVSWGCSAEFPNLWKYLK